MKNIDVSLIEMISKLNEKDKHYVAGYIHSMLSQKITKGV